MRGSWKGRSKTRVELSSAPTKVHGRFLGGISSLYLGECCHDIARRYQELQTKLKGMSSAMRGECHLVTTLFRDEKKDGLRSMGNGWDLGRCCACVLLRKDGGSIA